MKPKLEGIIMAEVPKEDLHNLREDFNKLREDMVHLSATLKDLGAERAQETKERLNGRLGNARDRLRERVDAGGQRGKEYYDRLGCSVSGRPMISLLTAFGIGFVVAKLFDLGNRR